MSPNPYMTDIVIDDNTDTRTDTIDFQKPRISNTTL